MTQVIQESIEDAPARVNTANLQLSQMASNLLREKDGIEKFRVKYGEYFVYGVQSRAEYSAVCTIKTSSKATRDKIKSSLEVDIKDAAKIGAELESVTASSSESLSIDNTINVIALHNYGDSG